MEKIPCDEQVRQLLDPVGPDHFYGEFHTIFKQVKEQGKLAAYQVLGGQHILITLDGTEYFHSYQLECQNCLL
jgi:hypothetical protein